MKKIIFMVVAIMLTFGLFAQDKIIIDEEAAKELDKLKTALMSAGIDYDDCSFIPDVDGKEVENALSVDEFIENLESGEKDSRSTYISYQRLIPIYELVPVGGGMYEYMWNGNVSSSPNIVGDDWHGVRHTRESVSGTINQMVHVSKPAYAYLFHDLTRSYPVLCAQLFKYERVYVPGLGYMIIPQPFGDKKCGTVRFTW